MNNSIWLEQNFEDSLSLCDYSTIPVNNEGLYYCMDIFTASSVGAIDSIKYLLRQENLVNAVNKSKWNALMYATYYGYQEVVAFLLDNGAFLHTRNPSGENVLMIAAKNGYESLVEYYLKCGSIIEMKDNKNWTALMYAAYVDHLEVVQVLLKYGANVNVWVMSTGKTPLILASENGNLAMVELLLQAGACFNFKCIGGKDAYEYAKEGKHDRVADYLKKWMIKVLGETRTSVTNKPNQEISRINGAIVTNEVPHQAFKHHPACQQWKKNIKSLGPTCSSQAADLDSLLTKFGLHSYIPLFREQGVDLFVFYTLTDAELKECGVTKLGPRRKMKDIIFRWHSNAPARSGLDGAYALKIELEKEELEAQNQELEEKYKKLKMVFEELQKKHQQMKADFETLHRRNVEENLQQKMIIEDLKNRLGECQKRCLVVGQELATLLCYGTSVSYQKFSETLGIIAAYLEDLSNVFSFMDIHKSGSSLKDM